MRLMKRKPVISETLESIEPTIPRPMRKQRLKTLKRSEEIMRSDDFRATLLVQGTMYGVIGGLQAALGSVTPTLTEGVKQQLE